MNDNIYMEEIVKGKAPVKPIHFELDLKKKTITIPIREHIIKYLKSNECKLFPEVTFIFQCSKKVIQKDYWWFVNLNKPTQKLFENHLKTEYNNHFLNKYSKLSEKKKFEWLHDTCVVGLEEKFKETEREVEEEAKKKKSGGKKK